MATTQQVASLQTQINNLETQLQTSITANAAEIATAKAELDAFYILWAACLVFLMQCGFAVLAAGSIRAKNVRNILLKNGLDACVGCVVWYLIGNGLAGGGNAFIGNNKDNFALSGVVDTDGSDQSSAWINFFFSYTFAAAAATIVSGAVAERCKLSAYIVYTIVITGFIYPVVVHWVWSGDGFMSAFNPNHILGGVIDFAGSGVVHMTGGIASIVGAKILGPRTGRWENPSEFEGHSTPLQILGTFLLWFGWYGFNCGSTLMLSGYANVMARVAVTTTLSGATAGCTGVLVKKFLPKKMGGTGVFDVGHTCNSLLGGLVGVTAGCATVSAGSAVAIGFVSAFVYHGGSCLSRKLKIDDPLDAFAVHGACGAWGTIAVGIFTLQAYSYAPHSGSDLYADAGASDGGIFSGKTRGELFGAQVVAVIIEVLWVGTMSTLLFGTLKVTGIFRVGMEEEEAGLDTSKHGGSAYANNTTIKTSGNSMA